MAKAVSEMTVSEIIINNRDNSGTDKYIKCTTKDDLKRVTEIMTAYWEGVQAEQDHQEKFRLPLFS